MQEIREKEWYKNKIADMLSNIENLSTIRFIYFFIKEYLKK